MNKIVILFMALTTLSGCMTSHVMLGDAREPISPKSVRIYATPPTEYQEVAMIQSSSKASWAVTEQQKLNKALSRMKKQAAGLGANGLLITGIGESNVGGVHQGYSGAASYGTGFTTSIQHKSGQALAIWVPRQD